LIHFPSSHLSCDKTSNFQRVAQHILIDRELHMYHYDPTIALEELNEDAVLPHPVKLRDMIMRIQLQPNEAQAMNSEFQDYLTRFGELQKVARTMLEKLSTGARKSA
jgi:hypothetical protein